MADVEVTYRAIADFSRLDRALARSRGELKKLQEEHDKLTASVIKGQTAQKLAYESTTRSIREQKQALSQATVAAAAHAAAATADAAATKAAAQAHKDLADNADRSTTSLRNMLGVLLDVLQDILDLSNQTRGASSNFGVLDREVRALGPSTQGVSSNLIVLGREMRALGPSTQGVSSNLALLSREMRALGPSTQDADRSSVRLSASFGGIGRIVRRVGRALRDFGSDSNLIRRFLRNLHFTGVLTAITGFFAFLSAIAPLSSALGALGGVILGVANVLGSLAGAALAIPPAFAAAAIGVGALVAAFSGIGDAFSAFTQQEEAAGGAATSSADAQVDAAERIKDAQIALADAREDQARAAEDAAERIEDAERSLARALNDVEDAQRDLNEARQEALQDLIDLREEVERASLNEEGAVVRLMRAQDDYLRALADPNKTAVDRAEALHELHEAEQNLADVQKENAQNAEDLADAEEKGVEGSDQVVDAQERLVDAFENVEDAQRSLERAQVDAARSQKDAARSVERAMRNLERAQRDVEQGFDGAGGAANEFRKALDKLSPSAREFVLGVIAMREAWEDLQRAVQEAFFQHLVDQLDNISSLLPVLENLLVKSADALGEVAAEGIEMISSGPWTEDFAILADRNAELIRTLGDAALDLLDAFRHLTIAAGPFLQDLAEGLADGAESFRVFVERARETGELADALEKVRERMSDVWEITRNVAEAIFDWVASATDFTDFLLDAAKDVTARWKEVAEAQREAGSPLQQFLEDIRPLLSEISGLIGDVARGFADMVSDPENIEHATELIAQLRDEMVPALLELFDVLAESGLLEAFIDLFTKIVELVTELAESGALQGLVTFLDTLGLFADVLGEIVSIPGVGAILGVIGSFFGAFAAYGFLRGVFALILGFFGKFFVGLGPLVRLVKKFVPSLGKLVGGITKLGPAIARVVPWLIRFAGPIGAIIGLVLALLPIIIENWEAIYEVIKDVVERVIDFLDQAWQVIFDLFSNAIGSILEFVQANWPAILPALLGPLGLAVAGIITGWDSIVRAFRNGIGFIIDLLRTAWAVVEFILVDPVRVAWEVLQGLWALITGDAERARDKFLNALRILRDGLRQIWNALPDIFKGPIKFFVNTVLDDWIIGNINRILGFLNLPQLPRLSLNEGGSVPTSGLNEGGFVPGSGNRDTVPALLTPGEFVVRKEAVRSVGLSALQGLNALQGFQDGGVVGFAKNLVSGVGDVVGFLGGLARKGLAKTLGLAFKPARAALSALPGDVISRIMKGAGNYVMDAVLRFVADKEERAASMSTAARVSGGTPLTGGLTEFAAGGPVMMQFGGLVPPRLRPNLSPPSLNRAAASVYNYHRGVNIGEVNVNNPLAEAASDSLYRQVQRLTSIPGAG